jgi:hypothetical protein
VIFSCPQLSRLLRIKPSADLSLDANCLGYVGKPIGLQKARKLVGSDKIEIATGIINSAVALAVAQMLIEASADIALRVLIPAVENSVNGDAYRPGDVLRSRKGLSVEITNPDAVGIQETARVDLVDHRTLPPGWCGLADRLRHRMLLTSGRVEPVLTRSAEDRRGADGASRPNRGTANF